ncbi:hypothetical protein GFD17_01035 [Bifidobacterium sp. SMB2]|uniref:Glycosyltransferase RgtA/B/C/D-like domain-containing protein n=1 Tax=Bifidobacterium saimiriisciurei TaxID=2661627 RepID=A0ABX0CEW6_9BIFI|nr:MULTISPECIES: DUF6020 family protein [Bifidobacterium]NEG95362.1 hypothetical protein [Bifidobacterium sp. SMB2]NEH11454.1 hypothetical protein [Bifidobacterium saimiriisciurei]
MKLSKAQIILGIICGSCIAIGNAGATGAISIRSGVLWIELFAFSVIAVCGFVLLQYGVQHHYLCKAHVADDDEIPASEQMFPSRIRAAVQALPWFQLTGWSIALSWIVILFCWLPYLVALHPGILYYDTGQQIAQFFGRPAWSHAGIPVGMIWDHHPWFDTYAFGLFAKLGTVLGSASQGLFLLCLLQCVTMSLTFAISLSYMRQRFSVGAPMCSTMLLFYAVFPLFPILFCTVVKDVFHAVFFLPWVLMYVESWKSSLSSLKRPFFLVGFFALTVLSGLTTKTGGIICLLSVGILIFVKSGLRKRILAVAFLAAYMAVTSIIIPMALFPALKIVTTDSSQFFVIPLQMTARYAKDNPNEATSDQIEAINCFSQVRYQDMASQYRPFITDPVSGFTIRNAACTGDYVKAWLQQGITHPSSYINAFVALEASFFSTDRPAVENPTYMANPPYAMTGNQMDVQLSTSVNENLLGDIIPTDAYPNTAVKQLYEGMNHIPVLNILTYQSFWSWMLPMGLLALLCSRKVRVHAKETRLWIVFGPYWLSLLSLYAGSTGFYM